MGWLSKIQAYLSHLAIYYPSLETSHLEASSLRSAYLPILYLAHHLIILSHIELYCSILMSPHLHVSSSSWSIPSWGIFHYLSNMTPEHHPASHLHGSISSIFEHTIILADHHHDTSLSSGKMSHLHSTSSFSNNPSWLMSPSYSISTISWSDSSHVSMSPIIIILPHSGKMSQYHPSI